MARLIRTFIALLAFCVGSAAMAQVACQVEYRGTHSQKPSYLVIPGRSVEDLSSVCVWGNSLYPLAAGAPAYQLVGAGATSVCGRWVGSTWEQSGIGVTSQKWFIKNDGTATQTDPGPVCSPPAASQLEQFCQQHAAAKNTFKMSGTVAASAGLPSSSCYVPYPPFEGSDLGKGCTASIGDRAGVPNGDGTMGWAGIGSFDGSTCSAAPGSPTPPSKDDPCPGGFQGTVNGETKCVPAEPDKGIEGVKNSSQTNADGTKVDTKETTKCSGSVCTTTTNTTTTTSSGTITNSTSSRTESLEDKCVKDPKNPVCKKTQGGAGSAASDMTCDVNASATGCGGEGAAIGDLYAKKDKTVGQALKKATDALQASPIGSSVTGFFSVGSGGSCPTISGTVPFLNKAVTFDMFCTSFAAQMFVIIRAVLLMLATWMAFRIAIDH